MSRINPATWWDAQEKRNRAQGLEAALTGCEIDLAQARETIDALHAENAALRELVDVQDGELRQCAVECTKLRAAQGVDRTRGRDWALPSGAIYGVENVP